MPRYNWNTFKVGIIHQSKSKWQIILLYNRLKFKLPGNNYVKATIIDSDFYYELLKGTMCQRLILQDSTV